MSIKGSKTKDIKEKINKKCYETMGKIDNLFADVGTTNLDKFWRQIASLCKSLNDTILNSVIIITNNDANEELRIVPLVIEDYFANELIYDGACHLENLQKGDLEKGCAWLYIHQHIDDLDNITNRRNGFDLVLKHRNDYWFSILIKAFKTIDQNKEEETFYKQNEGASKIAKFLKCSKRSNYEPDCYQILIESAKAEKITDEKICRIGVSFDEKLKEDYRKFHAYQGKPYSNLKNERRKTNK